jgi:hypothetical protein
MDKDSERFLIKIRNNNNFVLYEYVDGYAIGRSLGFNDLKIENMIDALEYNDYIEKYDSPKLPSGGHIYMPQGMAGNNLIKPTGKGIDYVDNLNRKKVSYQTTKNVIQGNVFQGDSSINQNIDSNQIFSIKLQQNDFIFIVDLVIMQIINNSYLSSDETKEISNSYNELKEALNDNISVNDKKDKLITTIKKSCKRSCFISRSNQYYNARYSIIDQSCTFNCFKGKGNLILSFTGKWRKIRYHKY